MNLVRAASGRLAVVALLSLFATVAHATNGMYLAGYGSAAAGRAGTSLAVADCPLELQANPAGIALLNGGQFGFDAQVLAPSLTYDGDPMHNSMDAKSRYFTMPSLAYAHAGQTWSWGLGLISQGGMGATFSDYATPFGTHDETSSEVRFLTVTPTVAYTVNEKLALGASVNAGYSDVTFRFYPNTSYYNDMGTPLDPSDDMGFFGANLTKRARAINFSGRVGAMWTVSPQVRLGAVYQTETSGKYESGTLQLNQTSIGLGNVKYDGTVDGFTWPQMFGAGVLVKPSERWRVALDVRDYLWSGAMKTITVTGENPDKASPMTKPVMKFVFDWKDAVVVSAGTEVDVNPALTLRGGFNYGANPVPDNTLNPLFPAITQSHATLGCGWHLGRHTINAAVERAFESKVTNDNTNQNVNPFGPGATVAHSQWTFSLGVSHALPR